MELSWSARRKITYSGTIIFIALFCFGFIWYEFFTVKPTCFDQKQNGSEIGVDCGGTCSLQCNNTVLAPQILWTRLFPSNSNTYTAAAYVQNNNAETGAHGVHYIFQLFDADNKLVVDKEGVMDIPPVQTVPVVESNISVGNRKPVRAIFAFSDTPVWEKVPHGSVPNIRIVGQTLSPNATRLDASIANDLLRDLKNVTVVAVLFDNQGVARTASKSVLPQLSAKSSANVVFTWPQGVSGITNAEISVLPSF